GDLEVMSLEQMVELFTVEGLLRKASVFDPQKLEWMNGQHLSREPLENVAKWVTPALVEAGLTTTEDLEARREWYLGLLDLLRVRARTIGDIVRQARPYFVETIEYDPDAVAKQWKDPVATAEILSAVRDTLATLEPWDAESMETATRALAESRGV